MNKSIKTICAYCEEEKQCAKWSKTDEMVCRECRESMADQEIAEDFGDPKTEYKSDLFPEDIFAKFPSIRK